MSYYLFKSEPDVFNLNDLKAKPNQTTPWDGVRNYQARNIMRAMKVGERGFFYYSNAKPSGIAGVIEVVSLAKPDETAFDPKSEYFDPKSTADNPRWFCVEVKFIHAFPKVISLETLKKIPSLSEMTLLTHSRLSVQVVKEKEWNIIHTLLNV